MIGSFSRMIGKPKSWLESHSQQCGWKEQHSSVPLFLHSFIFKIITLPRFLCILYSEDLFRTRYSALDVNWKTVAGARGNYGSLWAGWVTQITLHLGVFLYFTNKYKPYYPELLPELAPFQGFSLPKYLADCGDVLHILTSWIEVNGTHLVWFGDESAEESSVLRVMSKGDSNPVKTESQGLHHQGLKLHSPQHCGGNFISVPSPGILWKYLSR